MPGIGPVKFDITGTKDSSQQCIYNITITAIADTQNANAVIFTFDLNTSLFELAAPVAPPITNVGGNSYEWNIGDLPKDTPETATLSVKYLLSTGPLNVCPFINAQYTYINPGGQQKTHSISSCSLDVDPCEGGETCTQCHCSCQEEKTIHINACENEKEVRVPVKIKDEGKILLVDLNLPRRCANKDLAVLITISEVVEGSEISITHRIVKSPATSENLGCQQSPTCCSIPFFIPPNECEIDCQCNQCSGRTFIIRTAAHYLSGTSPAFSICN